MLSIVHDETHVMHVHTSDLKNYEGKRGKEGNVSLNDELSKFCLQLYGLGHRVKDISDSDRGNPLPPIHGMFFSNSSNGLFIPRTG